MIRIPVLVSPMPLLDHLSTVNCPRRVARKSVCRYLFDKTVMTHDDDAGLPTGGRRVPGLVAVVTRAPSARSAPPVCPAAHEARR